MSDPLLRAVTPTHAEDLCFTNFEDLRSHWNLLSARNPIIHDAILDSFVNGNLPLLDKGFSKRKQLGKLNEQAFNLLDEFTWPTCICCQMKADSIEPDRYHTVNRTCGKDRYCPRCSFTAEQSFWRKYSPYWTSKLDFYHITIRTTGPDYQYFIYSQLGTLFDSFHDKLKLIHKKMGNIQSRRTRSDWMLGSLWNEEAACVDLSLNRWNCHLHLIVAAPKGAGVDLSYLDDIGVDTLIKPIGNKSYFDNCLRYMCKPIHETLRNQYAVHWCPENSRILYQRVRQSMEILRVLFNKRKHGCSGYFHKLLALL